MACEFPVAVKSEVSEVSAVKGTKSLHVVSWSLTSPFSTNKAISETSGVEIYPYPVKEGQPYINLNPGRLFVH